MGYIKTIVISAFPGTGKTTLYRIYNYIQLRMLDSDSSTFDRDNFPANYIKHIKDNIGKADVILVSSHEEVRDALVANNIDFYLVYPDISLKSEYISRYRIRGDSSLFIELIEKNWDKWITGCQEQTYCEHVELPSMIFLMDIIDNIVKTNLYKKGCKMLKEDILAEAKEKGVKHCLNEYEFYKCKLKDIGELTIESARDLAIILNV